MSEDASISLPFADRHEAGRILASRLTGYAHRPDVTVLGLARGGVPVGFEIAKTLALRFDVFVVRKLGVPDPCAATSLTHASQFRSTAHKKRAEKSRS